jgi:hypothetical protein
VTRRRRICVVAGVTLYLALHWLGRTYGATRRERRDALPGDELTPEPMVVTNHAITIEASPAYIWPWLVQIGWHRGGWYTSKWIDRFLFPANAPSAERLLPEFQGLAVGDRIPDGPPESGCEFVVAALVPGSALVLHSTRHLPPHWEAGAGAWIDWTWAFALHDLGDGRTRLVVRSTLRVGPWWVRALYLLLLVPADFVMARQMLRGLARRVRRTTPEEVEAVTLLPPPACGPSDGNRGERSWARVLPPSPAAG